MNVLIRITFNKGFAVLVYWQPTGSSVSELGAIHLPGYPANQLQQKLTWQPDGAENELWMHLSFDKDPLAVEKNYLNARFCTDFLAAYFSWSQYAPNHHGYFIVTGGNKVSMIFFGHLMLRRIFDDGIG